MRPVHACSALVALERVLQNAREEAATLQVRAQQGGKGTMPCRRQRQARSMRYRVQVHAWPSYDGSEVSAHIQLTMPTQRLQLQLAMATPAAA